MNKENNISEKEYQIINHLSNDSSSNQREISKKLGFSLGLTNIIIKRLINIGYIKVKQLNRKKVEYLLTNQGFKEKTKKSYNYLLKTIDQLSDFKKSLQTEILKRYKLGYKEFNIMGKSDFSILAEIAFKDLDLKDIKYKKVKENVKSDFKGVYIFLNNNEVQEKDKLNIYLENILK